MSAFLDPIPATCLTTNDPILIFALEMRLGVPWLLAMFPEGELRGLAINEVNADFRYDFKTGNWINVSWGAGNDETDEEDDWGEGVQGLIPDSDGVGDGDQGDEADYRARDMDPSEGISE